MITLERSSPRMITNLVFIECLISELFADSYSAYGHVKREAFISGAEDTRISRGRGVSPLDDADNAIVRNARNSIRESMIWLEDRAIRRGGIGVGGKIEITSVRARETLQEVFQAIVLEGG